MTAIKGKNRHITLEQVYDMENLRKADREARNGKTCKYGVQKFDNKHEENLQQLRKDLMFRTYKTMDPIFEERYCDTKMRILSKVHYRYHIAHHALMNVINPVLENLYYYGSSASIKGRGIHYAKRQVERYVYRHRKHKIYHCQLDFKKFYHHVPRQRIYDFYCKMFTNEGIRWLLHDVIWTLGNHNGLEPSDGSEGMGIGLFPVQPLINGYYSPAWRLIAQIKGLTVLVYCDNILFLSCDSPKPIEQGIKLLQQRAEEDGQILHENYGVQLFSERHPVDFVGYKVYPTHTFIRNSTKYKFKRKVRKLRGEALRRVLTSYKGWLQCCNGRHLWQVVTHMASYAGFNTKPKKKDVVHYYKYQFIKNNKVYLWNYNRILECPL